MAFSHGGFPCESDWPEDAEDSSDCSFILGGQEFSLKRVGYLKTTTMDFGFPNRALEQNLGNKTR